jgi:lipoprotein-anchoring transpeptidase ErfK/SrfK
MLYCYEDDNIVYKTRVSTGARWGWKTETRYRKEYHVLSKDPAARYARSIKRGKNGYDVATPWKIVLCNEPKHLVRIHEFKSVPRSPASHGCIRVPSKKGKWIYKWVDIGTPVYFSITATDS